MTNEERITIMRKAWKQLADPGATERERFALAAALIAAADRFLPLDEPA